METKKDTTQTINDPTLRLMLQNRDKWEKWVEGERCKPKDMSLPAWRCDELLFEDPEHSTRFKIMADPSGWKPAHAGYRDVVNGRYVVIRGISLTLHGEHALWEVEYQQNKSKTWDRYRSLNRRWIQETEACARYNPQLSEREPLGIEIDHFADKGRSTVAVGDYVVNYTDYRNETALMRVMGRRAGSNDLQVVPYFAMTSKPNDFIRAQTVAVGNVRLVTMAACMQWILKLKIIMQEVANRGY